MNRTAQHPGVLRRLASLGLLPVVLLLLPAGAHGWVYPEHREITVRAIRGLDADRAAVLGKIWAAARTGHESRLSASLADTGDAEKPAAIDYASWPAIAGDHSCSAENMLHNILETAWIMDVAGITARLGREFSSAGLERHDRTNAMRDADLRLQKADPEYVTRAGSNNVHFLLARPYAETTLHDYIELCLAPSCELNALGAYAWYHLSALRKANQLSDGNLADAERSALALAALADEAFALHFLQDVFAAGHVAGTRGDASQRKGTHDYYNEHGVEVRTWDGKSIVLRGDAWMRAQDADRAAIAIRASLEQFLDATEGKVAFSTFRLNEAHRSAPDTMNTCLLEGMPAREIEKDLGDLLTAIVGPTPVPGLAEGEGELPRFRAELGPFIGFVPAIRGALISGAFSPLQKANGGTAGLEMAVRLGLGLDGVMNEAGDGLVFVDIGGRLDAASSTRLIESGEFLEFGSIFAALPSRSAITTRIRIPFWLLPFDLLLAAPILLPTDPEAYASMAVQAANGGLLPWQAGMATSFGRFQFVLGREIGVAFYGFAGEPERIIIPYGDPNNPEAVIASVRTIQLDFPVIEYMPFRSFSTDQSTSLVIQIFGGLDIPSRVTDIYPREYPTPDVRAVWQLGLRAAFRWRYYW